MPGRAAPMQYWRWRMVELTGWPLEYVDGLSLADWHEYWQIADGQAKAQQTLRAAATQAAARPSRKR